MYAYIINYNYVKKQSVYETMNNSFKLQGKDRNTIGLSTNLKLNDQPRHLDRTWPLASPQTTSEGTFI